MLAKPFITTGHTPCPKKAHILREITEKEREIPIWRHFDREFTGRSKSYPPSAINAISGIHPA
jgi:hypothetical protein